MSLTNKLTVAVSGGTEEERKVMTAFVADKIQQAGVATFTDWDTYSTQKESKRIDDRTMPAEFYQQTVTIRNIEPPKDAAFADGAVPRFGTAERFQDRAHHCTDAILEEIRGRKGIGNELEAFMHDDDTIDNLVDEVSRIIRRGMALTFSNDD